nr:unnamed protein product [Digitaria exilis]
MCGAPVFPPTTTRHFVPTKQSAPATTRRFVPKHQQTAPAVEVMEVASPAPSTPSGSSSPAASAPSPAFTTSASRKQQQLMAEAASGLAAARPVPQRLRLSKDFVPPPIKVLSASMPPAPDVMDAGSSAPSTPSDSSSSMETTPSPRGPLPSFSSTSAAPPCMVPTPTPTSAPPRPFLTPAPAMAPPRVEVRQVWAHNFEAEARLIESLLPKFRYVAVDTEFPGTVYRPAGAAYTLTPARSYELLKLNVDALDLIQLGLTLFDSGGRLPTARLPSGELAATTAVSYVWEFNFREFDVRRHRHAPESIAMLRSKGVDFDRNHRHGVGASSEFGPRLRKWLRSGGLGRGGVVTFSGGYDVAYLVKAMFGEGYRMPATAGEFEGVTAAALARRKVFDVKEMARVCPGDLRGGLDTVAAKLGVGRAVGEAHQAGSDSLLTCHAFVKMRERYFDDDDDKLAKVAGVLTDITAY